MTTPVLVIVVAISGGSVLAIEILGTRILGPYYGVSLFLWSALISVTLAALSLGYVLGGRLADQGARTSRLALIIGSAGIWMLLVPWMRTPLISLTGDWGLRTAVLTVSTVLFFPPLTLLGMVSPYAIRLRATQLNEVGRTAGGVFAISTLASVAAALATGFWLIPNVGVTRLTFGIGAALLLGAAVAHGSPSRRRASGSAAIAVALIGNGAAWTLDLEPATNEQTRFLGQSAYAEIEVRDRDGVRYLLIDGGIHTAVEVEGLRPRQEYVVVAELAHEFFEQPGDMLLIGLGGGAAARSFHRLGWRADAVEIDPLVSRTAREFFGLAADEVDVAHMDGRRYLSESKRHWELIFLDAFGSSSIPFHLASAEVFELMKARLTEDGLLVVNVESLGWTHPLVRALGGTLRQHFATVLALPIAEPPNTLGNLILIAANRPLEISDIQLGNPVEVIRDPYEHWRVVTRNHAWDNRFEPEAAFLITDDLNPVDLWSDEINRAARRGLHEYFKD